MLWKPFHCYHDPSDRLTIELETPEVREHSRYDYPWHSFSGISLYPHGYIMSWLRATVAVE